MLFRKMLREFKANFGPFFSVFFIRLEQQPLP